VACISIWLYILIFREDCSLSRTVTSLLKSRDTCMQAHDYGHVLFSGGYRPFVRG